jgi:hypothetical protein
VRALLLLLPLAACAPHPFEEMEAVATQHLGTAVVAEETTEPTDDGDVTTWEFDVDSGPQCIRGEPFRASVRESASSDDLVIFLQGGGACWSDFCLAIENAPAGVPRLDVLDPNMAANPVADWDVAYAPYCDGSLFAGEADWDDDGDGEIDRIHRGFRNLSATLDLAEAHFPNPRRVLLAGSSGGGYGTILATLMVRFVFPRAELYVFNDSGVGVLKEEEPWFVTRLIDEWDAWDLFPASCPECIDYGHLTPLLDWELERDPDLKVAAFSSYGDSIIADTFLQIGEEGFRGPLLREAQALHAAHPERYMPFLVEGTMHTTLLGSVSGIVAVPEGEDSPFDDFIQLGGLDTTQLNGVTVGQWLQAMLDGDPAWQPMIE